MICSPALYRPRSFLPCEQNWQRIDPGTEPAMQLPCPYCQQPIDCTAIAPGQAIRCPYCQAGLQMPGAPASQVSLPPAPAHVASLPLAEPTKPSTKINWPTTKPTGDPD